MVNGGDIVFSHPWSICLSLRNQSLFHSLSSCCIPSVRMGLCPDLARQSPAALCTEVFQGWMSHPGRLLRNTYLFPLFKEHVPKEQGSHCLNGWFHGRSTGKVVTSGQILDLNGLDFVRQKKLFCVKSSALESQEAYDICHNFRKIIAFLFLHLLRAFKYF